MKIGRAQHIRANAEGVVKAAEVILEGGLIVYPTDTTYAVGVNALNADAVQKVWELKGRSASKAMSVVLSEVSEVVRYADLSKREAAICAALLPGPVTLLLRAAHEGTKLACSGTTVGVRVPDSRFCCEVASLASVPVTATSANASGGAETYSLRDAIESLGPEASKVDLWVDGGNLNSTRPSTIIDLSCEPPTIVREGALSRTDLDILLEAKGLGSLDTS